MRVIIPTVLRSRILEELHQEHGGIERTKYFARGYIWWPRLDHDIEAIVKSCSVCQAVQKSPPKAPLQPWKWASRPWQRVHVDFAEKEGSNLLIIHDAYSKWIDAIPMKNITTESTVEKLRVVFAYFGLPEKVVSDNGPTFVSETFKRFLKMNGIQHHLVPVYHPASNGAAERSVQTVKNSLTKMVLDPTKNSHMSLSHKLASFLLRYRSTPHSVTGQTPASLFLKRELRNRFTLMKPNLENTVEAKQAKQVEDHDKKGVKMREFQVGEVVMVKNFRGKGNEKWVPGRILERSGLFSYTVQVGGRSKVVHVEHLRSTAQNLNTESDKVTGEKELTEVIVLPSVEPTTTTLCGEEPNSESADCRAGQKSDIPILTDSSVTVEVDPKSPVKAMGRSPVRPVN